MYIRQNKKILVLNILDILKKHTDDNHRLSQEEIRQKLIHDYDMPVDRKAIKRNLLSLEAFGYELGYTEILRRNKNGEDNPILTDWYLIRDFTDAELRLVIDSLLFSKHIPYSQCKKLIEKLRGLSSRHFEKRVRHISNLPENMPDNKELFFTIDILDEAISSGKKVCFYFTRFDIDKNRHVVKCSDGTAREYIVSPYQMVATNGRYYLICNNERYEDISHYRIDYISGIRLLNEPTRPVEDVVNTRLKLSTYMAEHIYMFTGESVPVTFRAKKEIISAVIDWFGKDISFADAGGDDITVRLQINERAMFYWALQYGESVEVLSPDSLRDRLRGAIADMFMKYECGKVEA